MRAGGVRLWKVTDGQISGAVAVAGPAGENLPKQAKLEVKTQLCDWFGPALCAGDRRKASAWNRKKSPLELGNPWEHTRKGHGGGKPWRLRRRPWPSRPAHPRRTQSWPLPTSHSGAVSVPSSRPIRDLGRRCHDPERGGRHRVRPPSRPRRGAVRGPAEAVAPPRSRSRRSTSPRRWQGRPRRGSGGHCCGCGGLDCRARSRRQRGGRGLYQRRPGTRPQPRPRRPRPRRPHSGPLAPRPRTAPRPRRGGQNLSRRGHCHCRRDLGAASAVAVTTDEAGRPPRAPTWSAPWTQPWPQRPRLPWTQSRPRPRPPWMQPRPPPRPPWKQPRPRPCPPCT